jgi:hypothetical protein
MRQLIPTARALRNGVWVIGEAGYQDAQQNAVNRVVTDNGQWPATGGDDSPKRAMDALG